MKAILVVVLLIGISSSTAAQMDSTLLGQRVRVRVADRFRQVEFGPRMLELRGTVRDVAGDTLTMLLPLGGSVAIRRADMRSLHVSRGVPSRMESAARRAAWWGIAGAYLGYVYLDSPLRDSGHTWEDGVGTGALIGVSTGLVVGLASPFERWRRLRLR